MRSESLTKHEIRIELSDEELDALLLLVVASDRLDICSVPELLQFHIGYLCENAFRTVREPEIQGPDES